MILPDAACRSRPGQTVAGDIFTGAAENIALQPS